MYVSVCRVHIPAHPDMDRYPGRGEGGTRVIVTPPRQDSRAGALGVVGMVGVVDNVNGWIIMEWWSGGQGVD